MFAAEHYASQLALPTSQRRGSVLPSSRRDHARKAFEKLTKTVLPATHGELARSIEREAREHDKRVIALESQARQERGRDDDEIEPGAAEELDALDDEHLAA